jgi:hypothetical protein
MVSIDDGDGRNHGMMDGVQKVEVQLTYSLKTSTLLAAVRN